MASTLVFCGTMVNARKVTVELPADLVRRAQKSSGEGITSTIRRGLELVAAGQAYRDLRRLKGRVSFSISVADLRNDAPRTRRHRSHGRG